MIAYKKLITAFSMQPKQQNQYPTNQPLINEILTALCDDLNTPKLLGLIFENLSSIKEQVNLAAAVKNMLKNILGLTLQPLKEKIPAITPEIQALIDQREQARKDKNWALADQLRAKLQELGYSAQDKKALSK
jgi:cysteinyl-tRNA synthetase